MLPSLDILVNTVGGGKGAMSDVSSYKYKKGMKSHVSDINYETLSNNNRILLKSLIF